MIDQRFKVVFPLPPSVNHSHREWIQKGRMMRVPTKRLLEWRLEAELALKTALKERERKWVILCEQKVRCNLTIYWPDKRKRDAHNIGKEIYDIMEGPIYDNDKWVLPNYLDFFYDKQNPRVEVEVYSKELDGG
jgi:crossover junction endodeoxyribonuclease RusA